VLTGIAVLVAAGGIIAIHLTGRAFTVPSTSMTNTLQPGDVVIAADTRQVDRRGQAGRDPAAPRRAGRGDDPGRENPVLTVPDPGARRQASP
jgi:signal peptidase I